MIRVWVVMHYFSINCMPMAQLLNAIIVSFLELVFMGEWWSGTDIIAYIKKDEYEKYYGSEHGYLLMNHTYEIDWLMGWMFCDRIRMLGVIIFLKILYFFIKTFKSLMAEL